MADKVDDWYKKSDENTFIKTHKKNNNMKTLIAKQALKAIYKKVSKIDVHEIRQMYGIYCQYYENTTWDIFLRDLSKKTGAFVLYCPKEDRVVGFSTVMTCDIVVRGKASRAVFSGDTVIEKAYWGSRALQIAFYKFLISEKIRYPRQAIHWLLISKGFKTYLLLANNFFSYYPNPEQKDNHLADVIDSYCKQMFAEYYDTEKRILDFGGDYQCLKGDVADITDKMRRDNHKIDFFEQCNPEWRRGTELPCVGVFDWDDLAKYAIRFATKPISKGRKEAIHLAAQKTKPVLAEVRPLHSLDDVVTPIKRRA